MNNRFDRTIPTIQEAVRRIRFLFAKRNETEQERAVIAGVNERLIQDLKKYNLEITSNYIHSIDNQHILHSFRKHGRARKGENPLTEEDFEKIPDYIQNYDRVYKSPNKNHHGLDVIIYERFLPGGTIIYLEEVRNRRESLTFVTMRKVKGDNSAASFGETDSPVRPKPSLSSSPSESKDTSF